MLTRKEVSTNYMPILDGWRAVAIILVLLFHGTYNTNLLGYPRLQSIATLLGRTGALGVLIFFVISGYLITKRLATSPDSAGKDISLKTFYLKRVFRIIPPLAVYLATIGVLAIFGVITLKHQDLAAPLFLTDYWRGATWYTSHFWSLAIEEQFYLLWPTCIFLIGWRISYRIGIASILAVSVWRAWLLHHHAVSVTVPTILQRADTRMDYIMIGAVVALALSFNPKLSEYLRKAGSGVPLIVCITMLLLASSVTRVDVRTLQVVLLAVVVIGSTLADTSILRRILANPVMLFIGRLSYSLYVWQELFLAPAHSEWGSLAMLPLRYLLAFIAAYLSYRFVELPSIAYGRKLIARSDNTSTASPMLQSKLVSAR